VAQRSVLVRYFGRVQGVGFRASVRSIAQDFKLKGWVKNESDGSVHMIVTAEAAEIEAFLKAVRSSRLSGYIDREVQESSALAADLKGFDIQY
jgi:acylphosphatase